METVTIDHDAIKGAMRKTMDELAEDAVRSMDEFKGSAKAAVDLQRVLSAKHSGGEFKKPIKIFDSLEESTMENFETKKEGDVTVVNNNVAVKTSVSDKVFTFNEKDAREAFIAAFKPCLEAEDIKVADIFEEIEKVKARKSGLSASKRKIMMYLGSIWDNIVNKNFELTQSDLIGALLGFKFATGGQRGITQFASNHVKQVFGDIKWEGLPNEN